MCKNTWSATVDKKKYKQPYLRTLNKKKDQYSMRYTSLKLDAVDSFFV